MHPMNSLFPLLIGLFLYLVLNPFSQSFDLLSVYFICAVPAGWSMINRYKNRPTDTQIIIREIYRVRSDIFFDLFFLAIRKGFKFFLALIIGWLIAPYLLFEAITGIKSAIRKMSNKGVAQ
ncbi:hypothetical protein MKX78_24355 [Cytobacillus sp. FSL R5-0569]|uniref:hypothetical protein n=1 Tax=Cytobacillus sp. FSL R5-0569 TaxID=2921649 RepID=UPI0030F9326B